MDVLAINIKTRVLMNLKKSGYWKQSIAMTYRIQAGSLKKSWELVNCAVKEWTTPKPESQEIDYSDWYNSQRNNPDFNPYRRDWETKPNKKLILC